MPDLMQVDFLVAEMQGDPPRLEGHRPHSQHRLIEEAGLGDARHRQHQMVQSLHFHVGLLALQSFTSAVWAGNRRRPSSSHQTIWAMESDMTETDTGGQLPDPAAPRTRKPRRLRAIVLGALLLGVGLASGFAAGTVNGMPFWMLGAATHHGLNPERVAKRIDRRVDRVLDRVDATSDQRDKVSGIVKGAFNDLTALGVKPWEARDKAIALLRADTIDPAAFETLRAEQISTADAASRRVVQALTEAAQVLTPEQRRELADRWERRGWRGHHGDRDRQKQ
jgi:Spy/CpxP family protein refolding chaperone